MYQERSYRQLHSPELSSLQIKYEACDLWLAADQDACIPALQEAAQSFIEHKWQELSSYISSDPDFATSLAHYTTPPSAPTFARQMAEAAAQAKVGPMAAVAGCFAQELGLYLTAQFKLHDLLIENGGDLWLLSSKPRTIALHAGSSELSGKVGLTIPVTAGLGVCTSSGTVGHSLSFGCADAVTVLAQSATLADAFATAIANRIREPEHIQQELANLPPELSGCVIILGQHLGAKGNLQLTKI